MVLAIAPAAVFADGSIDWFNTDPPKQGDEHLAPDAAEGEECGPNDSLIHWTFTAGPPNANTVSAATLHLNGHTYTGDNNGASWHFTTPLIELADITEAYVDHVGDVGTAASACASATGAGGRAHGRRRPAPDHQQDGQRHLPQGVDVGCREGRHHRPRGRGPARGNAVFGYSIHVTHSAPDISNIRVRGVITLSNPSNFDIDIMVTDPSLSDGTACELRDPSTLTILAGETINIAYRCFLPTRSRTT